MKAKFKKGQVVNYKAHSTVICEVVSVTDGGARYIIADANDTRYTVSASRLTKYIERKC